MRFKPLPADFYLNNTVEVARQLLGKTIVRNYGKKILAGKIVETEAYIDKIDPASHSHPGITKRNKPMFEKGGIAYIYFIYGNYYCFNIVTERKGKGCAVLIRAAEPIEGIEYMKKNRGKTKSVYELTNGPAKLCLSFGIDSKFNSISLRSSKLYIAEGKDENFDIVTAKRVGITRGTEFEYRFYIKNNPFVSKSK